MERVTFIASYSLAQQPAIRNRLTAYIKEGLAQGHAIRLISSDTEVPGLPQHNLFEHVPVVASYDHGSNFIKRAFAECVAAWRALHAARPYRDEHVVITIPSMFLLFLSPLYRGKRCYLDARDVSWEYLSNQSFLLRNAKLVFRMLAKFAIKRYRCVITTNETDQDFVIKSLGVPFERTLLIYNGVSRSQFELLSSVEQRGDKTISNNDDEEGRPVTVSYIGNVGLAQNLVTLVQAAERLPDTTFNIVGFGSGFDRVRNEVDSLGLKNVKLWGRVSWEKIPELYASSDILYAQLTDDYARAMPSKLYEYLSTGRFIIYGGGAQAKSILSKFENFEVIPPDDVEALVDSISRFDINRQKTSGVNRRLIQDHFIREDNVQTFYNYLKTESQSISLERS